MAALQNLLLPLKYEHGVIVDAAGKTILKAERDANKTCLPPHGRDAMLKLTCELLNEAFRYDKADQILKKLGY